MSSITETADNVFIGIPASPGIVIGKAYVLDRHMICVLEHNIDDSKIESELERFRVAVEKCQADIQEISEKARSDFGDDLPFMVFDAHTQLLKDPSLLKEAENIIKKRKCNAEWALKALLEQYHDRFSKIRDKYFRDRLNDIEQVITRLQRSLIQHETMSLSDIPEPVVIVAHDLSPADTIQMDPKQVIGFVTDMGGKTSHTGIVAASMDIPAVVGLKNLSFRVRSGDPIIVNGKSGKVVHMPTNEQFVKYNKKRQQFLYYDKELHAQKDLEAKTRDGAVINILANIESSHDLPSLPDHGARGVGLYRTEYLYVNKAKWPDEDEQYEDYKKVAQSITGSHAVIRTLDIGGDKIANSMDNYYSDPEPNPALGLRAIRFCLANPDIFRTQLRAILRASIHGKLKIMYPLITTLEELIDANKILDDVKNGLRNDGIEFDKSIEVGIMIETPSSVMIASDLAKHCSFFSIGTNDLIQYTMAIDRVNEKVAYLYQPLSPAILKMLSQTIVAADKEGVSVSVCGKMAGDPMYTMLLLGFGSVRELSMDVHSIPRIKKFIRSISIKDAKKLSEQALSMKSALEVRNCAMQYMEKFFVEDAKSGMDDNDP